MQFHTEVEASRRSHIPSSRFVETDRSHKIDHELNIHPKQDIEQVEILLTRLVIDDSQVFFSFGSRHCIYPVDPSPDGHPALGSVYGKYVSPEVLLLRFNPDGCSLQLVSYGLYRIGSLLTEPLFCKGESRIHQHSPVMALYELLRNLLKRSFNIPVIQIIPLFRDLSRDGSKFLEK